VSASFFAVRHTPQGSIISDASNGVFSKEDVLLFLTCFLNSNTCKELLRVVSATLNFYSGDIEDLPYDEITNQRIIAQGQQYAAELIALSKADWDSCETSWDFQAIPSLQHKSLVVQQSQEAANTECLARFARMKTLEEENNRLFIEAYGLQDELSP